MQITPLTYEFCIMPDSRIKTDKIPLGVDIAYMGEELCFFLSRLTIKTRKYCPRVVRTKFFSTSAEQTSKKKYPPRVSNGPLLSLSAWN